MKVSVVPAQITTVEDRIAGNLNFTQVLLLSVPQFFVAILFLVIPPIEHFSTTKFVLSVLIIGCSSSLAIRLKDKILLDIIKLRATYLIHSHTFVYRNSSHDIAFDYQINLYKTPAAMSKKTTKAELTRTAAKHSYKLLNSDKYAVLFKTKSGGLNVEVTNYK